jgi:uncharacterized protein
MKKLFVVHGWAGSPTSEPWFEWLKKVCKKKNIEVEFLEMPNANEPKIEEWVGHLEKNCKIEKETYFIGHSIGCQTIMRYVEKLPEDKRVAAIGFVAGFFHLLETGWEAEDEEGIEKEREMARPWIETPIDFEKIKSQTNKILAIFSEDDPCVPPSDSKLFKERLNAKIVIKQNEEHFNETKEIPELLEIFN